MAKWSCCLPSWAPRGLLCTGFELIVALQCLEGPSSLLLPHPNPRPGAARSSALLVLARRCADFARTVQTVPTPDRAQQQAAAAAGGGEQAAAVAAAMASDLRSAQGASPPARHELRNEREGSSEGDDTGGVAIYWLDYEGRAVQYGTLPAGKALTQGARRAGGGPRWPAWAGQLWADSRACAPAPRCSGRATAARAAATLSRTPLHVACLGTDASSFPFAPPPMPNAVNHRNIRGARLAACGRVFWVSPGRVCRPQRPHHTQRGRQRARDGSATRAGSGAGGGAGGGRGRGRGGGCGGVGLQPTAA